ncbi:MAG: hypothetical protein U9R66_03915 [Thermodesulfobacteriota bacterium]|nr:hypothetical protein [Thermodesulfobacteriota bacterium]
MMDIVIEKLIFMADWLFESLITPFFSLIGRGLELGLLKPLDFFHIPIIGQVVFVAVLSALLSWTLRHWLKMDEKDHKFKQGFEQERIKQQDIDLISDWKSRDALYRFTDKELDEDFNTYLAGKFARFMQVYMLPLFLVLFWLDDVVFSQAVLLERLGTFYLIDFSDKGWSVQGINLYGVFLLAYVISLIVLFRIKKQRLSSNKKACRARDDEACLPAIDGVK